MSNIEMTFVKDLPNKKILVTREFDAPLEQIWQAYTDSKILDQWWGPRPWKAETKKMDFTEGGKWLYAMVGPAGERHWAKVVYKKIDPLISLEATDAFCDENGNDVPGLPSSEWLIKFSKTITGTKAEMQLQFASEADMKKLIEMGFEEGMTIALNQLVELLNK